MSLGFTSPNALCFGVVEIFEIFDDFALPPELTFTALSDVYVFSICEMAKYTEAEDFNFEAALHIGFVGSELGNTFYTYNSGLNLND